MSTVDNLFVLHGLINHMLNSGKKLYVALIDFSKAFDYVVRDILWYKLIKLGVRGKILNVIKSMYQNVRSKVKFDQKISDSFQCNLGVRQGESLSPFLFSMYLNDLEDELYLKGAEGIDVGMLKLFILLYADDIVIFSESPEDMQSSLDILNNYCNKWKLKVNTNKTKIMVFRKGGILPRNLKFYFNNEEIEIVNKYSYLGIVFTTGGSFSEAQVTLSGQAQKAVFKLKRNLAKFENLTVKHTLELFDKLVSPILNYASEIWAFMPAVQVERVHLQFCKALLGVKRSCQNDFIYGELGRINYRTHRSFIAIKYWLKILQTNDRKYNVIIYKMLLNDIERFPQKVNWASLVRNELNNLGFNDVWQAQGVGHVNRFLVILKTRLKDNFMQNWNARINDSSRASFYQTFSEFQFQPYLNMVNIKKFRTALSKLRISSHRLEIEAGRWNKPNKTPRENRKCKYCNMLEDEFHFLFECSNYNNLRTKYFKPYYRVNSNMLKTVQLLKSGNEIDIKRLATYVFKAFELRSDILLRN